MTEHEEVAKDIMTEQRPAYIARVTSIDLEHTHAHTETSTKTSTDLGHEHTIDPLMIVTGEAGETKHVHFVRPFLMDKKM